MQEAALVLHTRVQFGARIRREDVKGRGLDAVGDRPLDGAIEDGCIVSIHTEDKATVHHYAVIMQAANGFAVIAVEILEFVLLAQAGLVCCLKSNEEAS